MTFSPSLRRLAPLLLAPVLGGCVGEADLMIYNPLTVGRIVQQTEIVKDLGGLESAHGLPPASLLQRAKLTDLDARRACFDVSLHSLKSDLDLRNVTAVLKEPSAGKIEGAQVWAREPAVRSYQGLVDETRQSGVALVCSYRDAAGVCVRWESRPTYVTYKVPGTVNVYESVGRMCFDHGGQVTARSERLILDLFQTEMAGWLPIKQGVAFRWGFAPVTKGPEAPQSKQK